ncbi:hypothetical protein [Duganella sp. BuS-21]|uniref:hypothetical protein n=1 Tax=Duganella sp. BuS-21 TaxID=2943848 RepID=UPI0035A6533E
MDVLTNNDIEFFDKETELILVISDDGRVAYAYLLGAEDQILGDVWLYNHIPTPASPEWTDSENMPFANSADYVRTDIKVELPVYQNDVSVRWLDRNGRRVAQIFFAENLFAELTEGAKPGWCRMAKKDGPVAKVLEKE